MLAAAVAPANLWPCLVDHALALPAQVRARKVDDAPRLLVRLDSVAADVGHKAHLVGWRERQEPAAALAAAAAVRPVHVRHRMLSKHLGERPCCDYRAHRQSTALIVRAASTMLLGL